DHFGGYLGDKTIGAVNLDSLMAGNPGQKLYVYAAAPGTPFFGNALLEMFLEDCRGKDNFPVAKFMEDGWYDDDTFLSDKTVGLPTVWFIGQEKAFWHNSMLTMQTIDVDIFARTCATIGTWIATVVTLDKNALPGAVSRAGTYALRHLDEEYRRILQQIAEADFRPGTNIRSEVSERMKYRLQIDIERLNDFRDVGDIPEIDRETALVTAAAGRLIAALQSTADTVKSPEDNPGKWFDYAENMIPSRTTVGFPYDQAVVSGKQRRMLPDSVIYGPFSRVLSNMDGKKNLRRLIREAEWEEQKTFTESEIKKYIGAVMYLGDYGYLNVTYRQQITQTEIVKALHRVGIKAGDCLFVHSSVSAFGRIDGGENAVIDALLEAVGPTGTILMPTFTVPFAAFAGELNKNRHYRPFAENDPSQIWVGSIPRTFLQRKGVIRSGHPSHSVAGFGPLAEACLKDHQENDPPTGKTSPFAKLVEFKGKILYFGCGLDSSTFLHFLETEANLPYLRNALCAIKAETGNIQTVLIPQHLPGHRDFYRNDAENCKFFRKVVANGLEIKESTLGLNKIQLINAESFCELGSKAIKAEPDILLCDNPECPFCSGYRRIKTENENGNDKFSGTGKQWD
ncbi:MAG: AAC(3) family N-acetyltransferase, partial [Victivallales bacterium]|nr:AAC(3) family N-acetyltransferase [Victivallales bacterium]